MAIKLSPSVRSCPVVKASTAEILFDPKCIANIAGAVEDKQEWVILLMGKRLDGGWTIKVNDIAVPPQTRSAGQVKFEPVEWANEPEEDGEGNQLIGVLHSHHGMGTFWSSTDEHGDNEQGGPNDFGCSVVVAKITAKSSKAAKLMGFDAKAITKVQLSCGKLGRVDSAVGVQGFEKMIPTERKVESIIGKKPSRKTPYDSGDCPFAELDLTVVNQEQVACEVPCGINLKVRADAIFGISETLMDEIVKQTLRPAIHNSSHHWFAGKNTQATPSKPTAKSEYGEDLYYGADRQLTRREQEVAGIEYLDLHDDEEGVFSQATLDEDTGSIFENADPDDEVPEMLPTLIKPQPKKPRKKRRRQGGGK